MHNPLRHGRTLFGKPTAKPAAKPEKKRRGLAWFIVKLVKGVCIMIGASVLLSMITSILLLSYLDGDKAATIPAQTVLHFPINAAGLIEYESSPYAFGEQATTVRDIVDALDVAAKDTRVKGILAEFQGGIGDLAHIDEVRNAILRFRESGKFAYIYAESFEGGMAGYYLASAFPQIWLQPMGVVSIPGIKAEMPFARELLDKLGVTPAFFHRKEYKNLFESLERNDMSDASRESLQDMLFSITGHIINGIAQARGIDKGAASALVNKGLLLDTEALEARLVDRLDYKDVLGAEIRKTVTGDPDSKRVDFIDIHDYAAHIGAELRRRSALADYPEVAIVYAQGNIASGDERSDGVVAAEDMAATFRQLARDESVKGILLRVSSPGGSPSAAETIRRGVVYAKERGKKVYVSMGGAAASGGYWISADADRIYAMPMTMTGSIGVAGGKFVLADMWDKVGVNWDGMTVGENAGIWSMNAPYTEGETERMNAMMDSIYDGFVKRVAEGRGMSIAEAEAAAKGRVWTGAQGIGNGLVDEIGGMDVALNGLAKELGQTNRFHLSLSVLPEPRSAFELLMELFGGQVTMGEFFKTHAPALKELSAMSQNLNVQGNAGVSAYEPVRVTD